MAQHAPHTRLRGLLAHTRNPDGGWPYYAGRQSRIEPTCWALLALRDAEAARLLLQWRASDGLLIEPQIGSVNFAFNGLAALALADRQESHSAIASRGIVTALLARKGVVINEHPAIKQNSSLQGWSWTEGTFSWVEPTAWCTLAAKKLAHGDGAARDRITEAERMLRDRACKGGGWNNGNTEIYGQNLLAHVPPSAAGVLAMQDQPNDPIVKDAVTFLRREGIREGSSTALALTWLALAAVRVSTLDLAAKLRARLEIVESLGNITIAALMTYVLDLDERAAQPSALML